MAPSDSSQLREAGLRKLVLARRWIVAASVTLTGVFTAVAANAFPGKTIKPSGSHRPPKQAPRRASNSPPKAQKARPVR